MITITIIILVLLVAIAILFMRGFHLGSIIGGASKLRIKNLEIHPRSRSEADAIKYLEEITHHKFPTAYPKWLVWKGKNLELDGYNDKLKLALEFSGPLHTKWNASRESYIKYFERLVRDIVKLRLCKRHGVNLIVIDASLPSRHWRNYLLSRLFDLGYIDTRPVEYIAEQTAVPFRNEQIERELGLDAEMKAAEKI